MPKIEVNGAELIYEESGSGPEQVLFAHGLLFSGTMFRAQVESLKERYRCITYDFRGQGHSQVTEDGYDMDTLYEDTAALIEKLSHTPCHLLGFSMGGFVAIRIAARRPNLVKSLILVDTSADPEPNENLFKYRMLNVIARWVGLWAVVRPVMKLMFGQKFLQDPDMREEREKIREAFLENDRIGVTRAVDGVLNRPGVYEELGNIAVPTLIIVGEKDISTPLELSKRMQNQIPGSKLVMIPGAGHMTPVEAPEAVNEALIEFLP